MKNNLTQEVKTPQERDDLIKQLQEMEFKKELPYKWEDLEYIKGYYIKGMDSSISTCLNSSNRADEKNKNLFKTVKQAKSALAMAQLSQLIAVYNDGWEADWGGESHSATIYRCGADLVTGISFNIFEFLAFKTAELRNTFLKNHEDLIKQYFMI